MVALIVTDNPESISGSLSILPSFVMGKGDDPKRGPLERNETQASLVSGSFASLSPQSSAHDMRISGLPPSSSHKTMERLDRTAQGLQHPQEAQEEDVFDHEKDSRWRLSQPLSEAMDEDSKRAESQKGVSQQPRTSQQSLGELFCVMVVYEEYSV